MKTALLQIHGMHCTSCAMNIDGELEDTEGVKEATTNYIKQQTKVIYDPEKISLEELLAVVKKADEAYSAEVIHE